MVSSLLGRLLLPEEVAQVEALPQRQAGMIIEALVHLVPAARVWRKLPPSTRQALKGVIPFHPSIAVDLPPRQQAP